MNLHPTFAQILDAHASVTKAVTPRDTYRGWSISFDFPPIPIRDFDWSATHPDYDGAEDANDNRYVHARTREAVEAEVDAWIDENGEQSA